MPKVYVCLPLEDAKIVEDMKLLTSRCECDVEIANTDTAKKIVQGKLVGSDGVIVALKQPLSDLISIDPIILIAHKHGKKIISIWPQNSQAGALPESLEKYSEALLPWDAEKLCLAICEDQFEWADSGGGIRAGSKTKRNKC